MVEDKYERYAILTAKAEELANTIGSLKEEILADMKARGSETEKHSLGKFTIAKLKRWTYPSRIVDMAKVAKEKADAILDEVKAEKAKSESTGEATYEEQDSLRFTSVKI